MKQFLSNAYVFITFSLLLSILPITGAAQQHTIELSSMGKFSLNFTSIERAQKITGNRVTGVVTNKPGASYQVNFPFEIQQIMFSGTNGQEVKKGDVVAEISGFDVHHFLDELEAAKTMFVTSKKHYMATKGSADDRTLKSTQWLEITRNYTEAKLNYEHFSHLQEVIHVDKAERFWVLSPTDGFIYFDKMNNSLQPNNALFEVVPANGLFVKVHLPKQNITKLQNITVENSACQLTIQAIEPIVENYHQTVWSIPTMPTCNLMLGQKFSLLPIYSIDGFIVPKESVFEWENQDYVAVKNTDKLSLVKVNIVGKQTNDLIVTGSELTSSSQVLSSSVSIAQGLFMGLGE